MPRSPYQAELELAKATALKAGEIIRSYSSSSNYGRSNNSATVSVKSGVDLVTEADTHVERIVTELITEAFPEDVIVGEEDQAERPNGAQGDLFPTGRIWCGEKSPGWVFVFDAILKYSYMTNANVIDSFRFQLIPLMELPTSFTIIRSLPCPLGLCMTLSLAWGWSTTRSRTLSMRQRKGAGWVHSSTDDKCALIASPHPSRIVF